MKIKNIVNLLKEESISPENAIDLIEKSFSFREESQLVKIDDVEKEALKGEISNLKALKDEFQKKKKENIKLENLTNSLNDILFNDTISDIEKKNRLNFLLS